MPMDQMMDQRWQTMSLGMLLVWVLIVAVIAIGIVAIVRAVQTRNGANHDSSRADASQILEERFARGEIDLEEFEERRRVINF